MVGAASVSAEMVSGRYRRFTIGALVVLLSLVAACSKYELSDRQLAFNDALQDADNRQILLNALRASRRYPLFFTAVGQISSTGVLDGSSISVNIPFGVPHGNIYTVNPDLRVQEGLTIATSPLNTQEFFRGFLAPVDPVLFAYYLDNGWNDELIYYAFIREIGLPEAILNRIKKKIFATCLKPKSDPPGILECIDLPNPELLQRPNIDKCSGFTIRRNADGDPVDLQIPQYKFANGTIDEIQPYIFRNQPTDACELLLFEYIVEQLRFLYLRGQEIPESAALSATSPNGPLPTGI